MGSKQTRLASSHSDTSSNISTTQRIHNKAEFWEDASDLCSVEKYSVDLSFANEQPHQGCFPVTNQAFVSSTLDLDKISFESDINSPLDNVPPNFTSTRRPCYNQQQQCSCANHQNLTNSRQTCQFFKNSAQKFYPSSDASSSSSRPFMITKNSHLSATGEDNDEEEHAGNEEDCCESPHQTSTGCCRLTNATWHWQSSENLTFLANCKNNALEDNRRNVNIIRSSLRNSHLSKNGSGNNHSSSSCNLNMLGAANSSGSGCGVDIPASTRHNKNMLLNSAVSKNGQQQRKKLFPSDHSNNKKNVGSSSLINVMPHLEESCRMTNNLFVALYDFESMSDEQLPVMKEVGKELNRTICYSTNKDVKHCAKIKPLATNFQLVDSAKFESLGDESSATNSMSDLPLLNRSSIVNRSYRPRPTDKSTGKDQKLSESQRHSLVAEHLIENSDLNERESSEQENSSCPASQSVSSQDKKIFDSEVVSRSNLTGKKLENKPPTMPRPQPSVKPIQSTISTKNNLKSLINNNRSPSNKDAVENSRAFLDEKTVRRAASKFGTLPKNDRIDAFLDSLKSAIVATGDDHHIDGKKINECANIGHQVSNEQRSSSPLLGRVKKLNYVIHQRSVSNDSEVDLKVGSEDFLRQLKERLKSDKVKSSTLKPKSELPSENVIDSIDINIRKIPANLNSPPFVKKSQTSLSSCNGPPPFLRSKSAHMIPSFRPLKRNTCQMIDNLHINHDQSSSSKVQSSCSSTTVEDFMEQKFRKNDTKTKRTDTFLEDLKFNEKQNLIRSASKNEQSKQTGKSNHPVVQTARIRQLNKVAPLQYHRTLKETTSQNDALIVDEIAETGTEDSDKSTQESSLTAPSTSHSTFRFNDETAQPNNPVVRSARRVNLRSADSVSIPNKIQIEQAQISKLNISPSATTAVSSVAVQSSILRTSSARDASKNDECNVTSSLSPIQSRCLLNQNANPYRWSYTDKVASVDPRENEEKLPSTFENNPAKPPRAIVRPVVPPRNRNLAQTTTTDVLLAASEKQSTVNSGENSTTTMFESSNAVNKQTIVELYKSLRCSIDELKQISN
uniref:Uncharacterized protein n=1 Tax=Romanomermis culicivorax TaxID=13658 RepID=A0A915HJD6_ROMCU